MKTFYYAAEFKPSYNKRNDIICTKESTIIIYAFEGLKARKEWVAAPPSEGTMRTILTRREAHAFCSTIDYFKKDLSWCEKDDPERVGYVKCAIHHATGLKAEMHHYLYVMTWCALMDNGYFIEPSVLERHK